LSFQSVSSLTAKSGVSTLKCNTWYQRTSVVITTNLSFSEWAG
jgi:hypothetical protein